MGPRLRLADAIRGADCSMDELDDDCPVRRRGAIMTIINIVPPYINLSKKKYAEKELQFGIKSAKRCGKIPL